MKKVIYTYISSGYDDLKEPIVDTKDWDLICFTDNPYLKSDKWDIQVVKGDPKKTSRKYKILNWFPNYDVSVYIDGTFQIINNLDFFALNKLNGFWINKHPQRKCAYKEAKLVVGKGLDSSGTVSNQIDTYKRDGFPKNYGLWRGGVFVRNPQDRLINRMTDIWWKEVDKGSWRDQISFPFACWKSNIKPNEILHGITQIYFRQHLHKAHIDDELTDHIPNELRTPNTHLYCLRDKVVYPKWLSNYITYKSDYQMIRYIGLYGGNIVYC